MPKLKNYAGQELDPEELESFLKESGKEPSPFSADGAQSIMNRWNEKAKAAQPKRMSKSN